MNTLERRTEWHAYLHDRYVESFFPRRSMTAKELKDQLLAQGWSAHIELRPDRKGAFAKGED